MSTIGSSTLFRALRNAYLLTTALALSLAGLALLALSLATLHQHLESKLELLARTIAYSTEAAVLFGDRETAAEILAQIAEREHLSQARITLESGAPFVTHARPRHTALQHLHDRLGSWLFPNDTEADILHNQQRLGRVSIRSDGAAFITLMSQTLMLGLLCLLLAGLAAQGLARLLERRITSQLDALAAIAHSALTQPQAGQRLPSFSIAEFDALAKDFNALLAQLESRHQHLKARQSDLEKDNQTLTWLAMHDNLTGLSNRAAFLQGLNHALLQAPSQRKAVLYLDNDGFKQINDRLGHAAGDTLLVEVARRLRGAVRESDLVARLGGDEFAVLLSTLGSPSDATRVAVKILELMKQPLTLNGQLVTPGVSIGIAMFPDHADNANELLKAADHAMYQAKRAGRNRYQVFDASTQLSTGVFE